MITKRATPAEVSDESALEGNDPFGLRRFSLRRYTVRHLLYMFVTLVVLLVLTVRLLSSGDGFALALAASGTGLMGLVFVLSFRATVKRIVVEQWIRRLGMGDFEYRLEPRRRTEVDKMLVALEAVRQKALEAMQLDLVRRLSEELQEKNAELERTLAELRQAQDRLVSQQKLRELHTMSVAIAHELNNPLNLAMNFSDLSVEIVSDLVAEVEGAGPLPEERRSRVLEMALQLGHNVGRVLASCGRASRVVRDVAQVSAGAAGQYRPVELNRLVRTHVGVAVRAASRGCGPVEVRVDYNLDPAVGTVSVVPEDLARVVARVVDNACLALRDRVASCGEGYDPCLEVSTRRSGDGVFLTFRDNGVGMAEDVRSMVFNPFFTTRAGGEGTGLGLTVAYDVVREHGGTLEVCSESGVYTEVVVSLPDVGPMEPSGGSV